VPTYFRDEAIVLRTHNLGEHDRIITALTPRHGKIRFVAKGVRKTKSRFGSRLEPMMHTDIQCYEGRNLDTLTQAVVLDPWAATITRNYAAWTAGQAMLETCDRLTEEREPAVQQFRLLSGALTSLALGDHDSGLVLDAYLLRALAVAGWAPSFTDCARCGDPGPHKAFNVQAGGSVCAQCRPGGSAAPSPETLRLLAGLLSGDWTVADAALPRHRVEGSGLTAAFLQWHLERHVRSLRLVERT
jgi:DNA repair protein RecO (recombination protein O)